MNKEEREEAFKKLSHLQPYMSKEGREQFEKDFNEEVYEKLKPVTISKHWIQKHWDYDESGLLLEDPEMRWKAVVRRDGCVELYKAENEPLSPSTARDIFTDDDEDCSQMHICDIDDMIERLQSLKRYAIAIYDEGWPH